MDGEVKNTILFIITKKNEIFKYKSSKTCIELTC